MSRPRKDTFTDPITTSGNSLYSTLVGEALVFSLLAKALYVYIDRAWLQSLAGDNFFEDIPFAGGQPKSQIGLKELTSWSEKNRGGITDNAYDDLRSDYTRLFVFPGEQFAPPWESVYFNADQLMFQEQTMQVRSWYRRFGLEPKKLNNEPDDHIALEISFIVHLAVRALNALESNNNCDLKETISAQRRFLREHLLRWGPQWCKRVSSVASTDFFRGIAFLADGSLCELSTLLGVTPSDQST